MIKAEQDTNKSKPPETSELHLYALVSRQILSEIAPIFLKLVFVSGPGSDVPVKSLNLFAKFSKFLFLSVSFLSSVSEI